MTIPLQWLADNVWIFYVACVIGALVYLVQALSAQRELRLAMFSLERDRARSRILQSWILVCIFLGLGVLIYFLTVQVLPDISFGILEEATVTPELTSGINPPTSTPTSMPAAEVIVDTPVPPGEGDSVETVPEDAQNPVPTVAPTEIPDAAPTDTVVASEIGVSGEVRVQFGDFSRLVGFSLPTAEVGSGEALPLTLYWEALQTPQQGYLVFAHLLSTDGLLLAQHDGAPAGGTRPTDGWNAGDSIVDLHTLVFLEPDYVGEAIIAVGLYDPAVGRLLADSGDDSVVLPVTVNISAR